MRWRARAPERHPTGDQQTAVWQAAKHMWTVERREGRTQRGARALTPLRDRVRYPPMSETAETLRRLHIEGPMLVLPNAWDAGSARIFVEAGFPALATTSAGIAFSLGYPDGERISREEMLAAVARITRRIAVPITADLEAGYGREPAAVAETVRRAIDAGVVGMNLEDRMEEKHLIDFTLAVERVRAALGVRRVTFGSGPMRATLGLVRRMAREWREKGTYGTLEAYGIPFADLQKLFA